MANKITLTAQDGSTVEFYDEIKAQGGVKDVYFSTDKTYVVAFYRKPTTANDKSRLENIVGVYREKIFIRNYCCPLKLFIQNKLGLTLLTKYQPF